MFSLRRSTCVLIFSYKLWRFSTAVSMVSYNLRPSEKKYILKFNHTEYRGLSRFASCLSFFASILTKIDNLLYLYAHANMCLPLCWTGVLILLFFWRQERRTLNSTNRTLDNQHGDYDRSKFSWCISSICKLQKATVTYIPGEVLYKKAFRWYLATTLLFFRFLFFFFSC